MARTALSAGLLGALFRQAWSSRTSTLWTPDAPSRGQCGVTALVVHDHLGGEILKTRVGDRWHFYNRIDDAPLDLTADQFEHPIEYLDVVSSREEAMADTSPEQYEALSRAFARALESSGRSQGEPSPWLSIPLGDYEAHMALPDVAQAPALASELAALLRLHRPASIAVLGCSGGNGLERVDPAVTRRVVALDINPAYVAATRARFGRAFADFEPVVCDIAATPRAPFRAVELAFAGLLLEYVPLDRALRFVRSGLVPGGVFGCVVQQDSEAMSRVSASSYTSLAILGGHMRRLDPDEITRAAGACGLRPRAARPLTMPNGKVLVCQTFTADSIPEEAAR